MSRQTLMESFYNKSKSPVSPGTVNSNNVTKKRLSLSLKKPTTPKKVPKVKNTDVSSHSDENVIVLSSDDESNENDNVKSVNRHENSLSCYTNECSFSPKDKNICLTPNTPRKSPGTCSSNNSNSPNRKLKFFSPTKKRAIFKTPIKRNLSSVLNCSPKGSAIDDEDFLKACEGMDDKSIFLLTIINKFLKHDKMRELLDDHSQELLHRCLHLEKPGARVLCRLYWRQRTWYKKEQVIKMCSDKDPIGDPSFRLMVNCLLENDIITEAMNDDGSMTFNDFTKVLKSDELKQICKELKLKIQSKQNAVDALHKFSKQSSISKYFSGKNSDNSTRVLKMMRSKAGPCYKLTELASTTLYKLYILMYLGMNYTIIREKRLELMLINNKVKSETYPVDQDMKVDDASIVFRSRDDFDKYLKAHIMYENYLTETDLPQKFNTVREAYKLYQDIDSEDLQWYAALPAWLRRYTPANIYAKIMETGVQELKKGKCEEFNQLAIDILSTLLSQTAFRQHKRPDWFVEKAHILHKLMARHDEAAEVLIEGLKSDLSEDGKDIIRPKAMKLANRLNITLKTELEQELNDLSKDEILENSFPADHIAKQHMENPAVQRGKKKFVVETSQGKKYMDAEDYCVYHYTTNGCYTDGHHWEGRIVTTIFFLLFWEIIYTKPRGVVGVFLSHYQMYPLDMFTESFYINRKDSIDDWLNTIENTDTEKLIDIMHQTWKARPEHELSGIHRAVEFECVRAVVRCAGARRVAALCGRLAREVGAASGFPDLTLWNTDTGQIKFVEVKTDTDKPSRKQLQWMQYLKNNDIATGFCYIGANTTRCRARASTHRINVKSVEDINKGVLEGQPQK